MLGEMAGLVARLLIPIARTSYERCRGSMGGEEKGELFVLAFMWTCHYGIDEHCVSLCCFKQSDSGCVGAKNPLSGEEHQALSYRGSQQQCRRTD